MARKEFETVAEFKEFLSLLKGPETRKATLTALKSLPNMEMDSAQLAKQAKVSEAKVRGALAKLKDLDLVKETKPGRFRAPRGFGLAPNLQRQLAELPTGEQEDMIRLQFESQRESLNTLCEFWDTPGNPSKWLDKWGQEQPNLSFGISHVPASMAKDVFRVMAKFEGEVDKVLEKHRRRLGDEEVAEPLLLVQWLMAPTG